MLFHYKIINGDDGNNYMVFPNGYDVDCFVASNRQTHGHLLICSYGGYFNALCINVKHGGAL